MKVLLQIMIAALFAFTLTGCGLFTSEDGGDSKVDAVDTGEIIGFTYLMTKDELSQNDRENIEEAYHIFAKVANDDYNFDEDIDFQSLLLQEIDSQMPGEENLKRRTAARIITMRYWNRVDAKYNINISVPTEQLAILQQVYIGIERGLGRGE